MNDDGSFTITGKAALQHAEICRLVGALGIEITTGMKASRFSSMNLANRWSGSPKRTKKGALEDLLVWFYTGGGTIDAMWNGVTRALGEDRAARLKRKCEKARKAYLEALEAREAEALKAQEVKEIEDLLKPLD